MVAGLVPMTTKPFPPARHEVPATRRGPQYWRCWSHRRLAGKSESPTVNRARCRPPVAPYLYPRTRLGARPRTEMIRAGERRARHSPVVLARQLLLRCGNTTGEMNECIALALPQRQ